MTSLSLVAAYCGREDGILVEFGSNKEILASGLLRSSLRRVNGYKRTGIGRGLRVIAKVKKWKKHDYPWPDDIDPNIDTGHLSYLSHFKPLAEKPKPVTLPFEKPLMDLEKRIIEVRRMADETGLDFSDQIGALESKYQQALKDLYTHLTPIQRLTIARHPNRPTVLDHIFNITEKWVELHGDRAGYDDPAIVTGIGTIDGKSYMFIGHQKGRNTKENIARNFAMPTPHGYRKALRMMKYADHHGFPIITFVDTPGAFADLKSEELGQGEAIAHNLRTMFGLKVPIITVVTGEGGSGGALAIACANKLFMLENSAFYVASPEACAAILWKSSQAAPKAAEKLRITAQEHYRLKIADGIIAEPLGGAHADPSWTSQQIKITIIETMKELGNMDKEELLHHRMLKFRYIGGFQEGVPVEPERKRNMKPSDGSKPKTADIEVELENLKRQILESKRPVNTISSEAIEKLKQDVDQEITNAFISMGLQEKLELVKLELSKAPNRPPNQPLNRNLKEKVDKIMEDFKLNLSRPGAYLALKHKLQKLNAVHRLMELKDRSEKLKAEINQKVPEEVKAKMKIIRDTEEKLSKGDVLNKDLVEEVERANKELLKVLESSGLQVIGVTKRNIATPPPALRQKIESINKDISQEIERVIDVAGLNGKVEELKSEITKGSSSEKVEKLESEIKEKILSALDAMALKEKFENIREELVSALETTEDKVGTENGRL
ncbi:acetyl-coenzyme A carboxylase carboxyl transferase subunit alpha, chloroplastic [Ricinus communis]|uniref:acetyl-CoA carboxytransferase n=1 Tax=Ricinus communis TaxID=3988 RepID=B9RDP1_RICCO|nr:acetyl-coenzyme A carboxylase carboxyl transferase subunit alpha, chloroplastic [Ricinus communis]EEF50499.1 acetyl-coenzyme A carboxylase carboxyl transferase alpha, putative [Ricinus communis]|eukprot:XP_002511830.1 acetyl-coenzyme A carboxylase carboxyl transferase subunit alpha, chloroplastic [Ricinus communis]